MSLDKMMSKSKTNYKVYTPLKVAREIVAKALSFYFVGDKKEKLNQLRAVDLACGNGNLLIVLIESLIKINKIYYGKYDYNPAWVDGYDIDLNALEEFEIKTKELFKKYGIKKQVKFYNQDSLITEFKKSYNLIIGNPPYIGEKNNREIFEKIKKTEFGQKYYEGKMDYLYFFIEKAIDLLEPQGVISYITTNYWLRADSARILRRTVAEKTNFVYINNINKSVFKDALGQHNVIFTMKKSEVEEFDLVIENRKIKAKNSEVFDENEKIVLMDNVSMKYCRLIQNNAHFLLGDKFNVNQGIVSGYDKAFVMKEPEEEFGEYLKKFYKNKDIHKYRIDEATSYILYLDKKKKVDEKLLNYVEPHKERLEKRREVQKKIISWWQLQWARDENIFKNPKIVARQRNRKNNFALTFEEFYASADVYYISPKNEEINLYYILAYLNSELFYNWFKINGKNKGEFMELYATPLKKVPIIYDYDKNNLMYIETLVKKQMEKFSDKIQEEIEDFFKTKVK